MKNNNYYDLSRFEKTCYILYKLFNVLIFIFALQAIFVFQNIIISVSCLVFCIISFGYYIASQKINEKFGHLLEIEENYQKILEKYSDSLNSKNKKE